MVELIVLGAFALSLFVCVGLGVSILYALILGFVLFCGYGVYRGHGLREMLSLALSGVRTVKGILLTFLLIGVITALWRRRHLRFILWRPLLSNVHQRPARQLAHRHGYLPQPWRDGENVARALLRLCRALRAAWPRSARQL